jgi:hypothetical protein
MDVIKRYGEENPGKKGHFPLVDDHVGGFARGMRVEGEKETRI